MKRNILKWLWVVSGRGKLYVAALLLAQILNGASGVMYSMILRGLVDATVGSDSGGLRHHVILLLAGGAFPCNAGKPFQGAAAQQYSQP